jgi:hypothetical protein
MFLLLARKGTILLERAPHKKGGVMVIKMSKSLEAMFAATCETAAKVGVHNERHMDRKATEIQETAAKVGVHVEKHMDRNHEATRSVIRDEAENTRGVIRDEADGTRRVIRDESNRLSESLRDRMEWPEIFIGLLFGIIAGIGMWFAEKGVIIKPIQWDAAGNVLKYGPDTFLVVVLSIVLGVFVFFLVSWIVHSIRARLR